MTPSRDGCSIPPLIIEGALAEWLTRCPAKAISSEACVRITQASMNYPFWFFSPWSEVESWRNCAGDSPKQLVGTLQNDFTRAAMTMSFCFSLIEEGRRAAIDSR